MSLSIDCRIYDPEIINGSLDLFLSLSECVSIWHKAPLQWYNLHSTLGSSDDHQSGSKTFWNNGPLASEDLLKFTKSSSVDGRLSFSSTAAYSLWRYEDGSTVPGKSSLRVQAFGTEDNRCKYADTRVEGVARLKLEHGGPYWACIDDAGQPESSMYNIKVAENNDHLLSLVVLIADHLAPSSIKIFADNCVMLPFNSHIAFYRDYNEIVRDVQLIGEAWSSGMPAYKIRPLPANDDADDEYLFSGLRSKGQRNELRRRFADVISLVEFVDVGAVERGLQLASVDVLRCSNGGLVLLNFPFCFNAFIDGLLADVIDSVNV